MNCPGCATTGAHPLRCPSTASLHLSASLHLIRRLTTSSHPLTHRLAGSPWSVRRARLPAPLSAPHNPTPSPSGGVASPASHVRLPVLHQVVHDPTQLVRRRRDRLRRTEPRSLTSQICPRITLAPHQTPRRQSQRVGRATLPPSRPARLHLPPVFLKFGHNPSQLEKCFTVGHLLKSVPNSPVSVCRS